MKHIKSLDELNEGIFLTLSTITLSVLFLIGLIMDIFKGLSLLEIYVTLSSIIYEIKEGEIKPVVNKTQDIYTINYKLNKEKSYTIKINNNFINMTYDHSSRGFNYVIDVDNNTFTTYPLNRTFKFNNIWSRKIRKKVDKTKKVIEEYLNL